MDSQTPIADAIAEYFDSHGIYDRNRAVTILQAAGWTAELPQGMTHKATWQAIEGRGLGGELAPEEYPGQRFIAGYTIAEFVGRHIGADMTLANQLMGRGSRFRAALDAIRNAERAAWSLANSPQTAEIRSTPIEDRIAPPDVIDAGGNVRS